MRRTTRRAPGSHDVASRVYLDAAKVYARAGELEAALESLEDAVRSGRADTWWWADDPDLRPLRGEARFEALIRSGSRLSVAS